MPRGRSLGSAIRLGLGVLLLSGTGLGCTLFTPSAVDGGVEGCQVDRDCSGTTPLCRQFECVSRCAGVVCGGEGETRCDPGSGECVPYLGEACASDLFCPVERPLCVAGHCRGDRQSGCASAPCAPGLSCISVRGDEICLQPCGDAPCQVGERCLDASYGDLAAFCAPNLCRPGGGPEDTLVRDAEYGEACETDGSAWGVCVGPLPDATLVDVGLCLAPGQAPPGGACDPAAPAENERACGGGVCVQAEGQKEGQCFAFCSAFGGRDCPAGQACQPQWGGFGVCFELLPDAAEVGAPCNLPVDGHQLVCVEGSLCLPEDLDAARHRCLAVCDPEAGPAGDRGCESGSCLRFDPTGNPFLGVCVGP